VEVSFSGPDLPVLSRKVSGLGLPDWWTFEGESNWIREWEFAGKDCFRFSYIMEFSHEI
jgi:hypothetical protein